MRDLLARTFGGLRPAYYLRQLFFGAVMAAIFIYAATRNATAPNTGFIIFAAVNTLLYPYARFTYERIMAFLMGDNVFVMNAIVLLFVKLLMMVLCWSFAIFIAPLGLIWLLILNSRSDPDPS